MCPSVSTLRHAESCQSGDHQNQAGELQVDNGELYVNGEHQDRPDRDKRQPCRSPHHLPHMLLIIFLTCPHSGGQNLLARHENRPMP
jgi:hypothetical protein